MSKWIKASEQLPAIDGAEVVFTARGQKFKGRYYPTLPYPFENEEDSRKDPIGAYRVDEVTCWMHLSDPLEDVTTPVVELQIERERAVKLEVALQKIADWENRASGYSEYHETVYLIRIAKEALK